MHRIEEVLEVHLPVFAMRLREYEMEEQMDEVKGGFRRGDDPMIEYRKNQITVSHLLASPSALADLLLQFAKREGEVELRAVRRRLGRLKEEPSPQGDTLGTFTLHNWVTRALP